MPKGGLKERLYGGQDSNYGGEPPSFGPPGGGSRSVGGYDNYGHDAGPSQGRAPQRGGGPVGRANDFGVGYRGPQGTFQEEDEFGPPRGAGFGPNRNQSTWGQRDDYDDFGGSVDKFKKAQPVEKPQGNQFHDDEDDDFGAPSQPPVRTNNNGGKVKTEKENTKEKLNPTKGASSNQSDANDDVISDLKVKAADAIDREDFAEAEALYSKLLRKFNDDDESPALLGALKVFGKLLVLKGDIQDAVSILERALMIICNIHGMESAEAAAGLVALGGALRRGSPQQIEEAEQVFGQAIEVLQGVHGEQGVHADIATAILGLGMTVEAMGRFDEAIPIYEDVLGMRRKLFGRNNADTADAILCLASLLARTDDTNLAAARYEQALGAYRSIYEDDQHPRIQLCIDSLAILFRRQAKDLRRAKVYAEAAVADLAALRRCAGNPVVSGYFTKISEASGYFSAKSKRNVFASVYPVSPMDTSSQTPYERDGHVLIWAYDDDNDPGSGSSWLGGGNKKGADEVCPVGETIELNQPIVSVDEPPQTGGGGGPRSGGGRGGVGGGGGGPDDEGMILRVMNAEQDVVGNKGFGGRHGAARHTRRIEVFSAYVRNPDQAQEWVETLAFDEGGDQNA